MFRFPCAYPYRLSVDVPAFNCLASPGLRVPVLEVPHLDDFPLISVYVIRNSFPGVRHLIICDGVHRRGVDVFPVGRRGSSLVVEVHLQFRSNW